MFGFGKEDKCEALEERIEKIDDRLKSIELKLLFTEGKKSVFVLMGRQDNWDELLKIAKANGYEYFWSTYLFWGTSVEFKKKEESKHQ